MLDSVQTVAWILAMQQMLASPIFGATMLMLVHSKPSMIKHMLHLCLEQTFGWQLPTLSWQKPPWGILLFVFPFDMVGWIGMSVQKVLLAFQKVEAAQR
jgi:hypothetical protein